MAEVYWIHLPEHTDMFSEGYIGITSKTTKERYRGHIKAANRKDRKYYPIQNAINKYRDTIVVDTLVVCSNEYAVELEAKLRPSPKIGWNIMQGGVDVKFLRVLKETTKHTAEAKDKMSVIHQKLWEGNSDRLAKRLVGRKSKPVPVDAYGNSTKFWAVKYSNSKYQRPWNLLDEIYDYFTNEVVSTPMILKKFNLEEHNKGWLVKISRYFLSGWNPSQDPLWIEDFKQGGVNAT